MEERQRNAHTRAGHVAIIGRPNVGKSSLLNRILGERLSIVTPKAQTTRRRVTGIYTTDGVQMVFLDTPGLLAPRNLLQRAMVAAAEQALEDADVVLLLLDGTGETQVTLHRAESLLSHARVPVLIAINKIDLADSPGLERISAWARQHCDAPMRISATEGTGVTELLNALRNALPQSPFFFPEDELSTDNLRFFVEELIRETVFEKYRDEVPYAVAVRVEAFREAETPVYIQANLFVERASQKQILIGGKGAAIRELGTEARIKIERLLGERVYLDLWVKVLPDWRRRRTHLMRLGFRVPMEADDVAGM